MAWLEDETWEMEQGIDALKIFELFEDEAQTTPWQFIGWDVNATVSDDTGKTVYQTTVDANATLGTIRLILPEATVNNLKIDGNYRYDCLMVPPGSTQADDIFLATGEVVISLRSSRRD